MGIRRMLGRVGAVAAGILVAGCGGSSAYDGEDRVEEAEILLTLNAINREYPTATELRLCISGQCERYSDPGRLTQVRIPIDQRSLPAPLILRLSDPDGVVLERARAPARLSADSGNATASINYNAHSGVLGDQRRRRRLRATEAIHTPVNVDFWDENRGLVGTGVPIDAPAGTILRTEDGGRTFEQVLRSEHPVAWLDVAGDDEAWAMLDAGDALVVTRTADGGESWEAVSWNEPYTPSFATATLGMAVAGDENLAPGVRRRIRLTEDGGDHWSGRPSPCPDGYYVGVSFPAPKAAWAVCTGEPGAGFQPRQFFFSNDTGRTWQPRADHAGSYTAGIDCAEDGLCFVQADEGYGVQLSTDGARTWRTPAVPWSRYGVRWTSVLPGGAAYTLSYGQRHRLLFTRDSGATWELRHAFSGFR
jgi:photosystem II stability/assembly factor-like uncharacterized protein